MDGLIVQLLEKNFGFIRSNGKSYFFHRDDYIGHWQDLKEDFDRTGGNTIRVEFVGIDTEKGPRASDVRRMDFPNQTV